MLAACSRDAVPPDAAIAPVGGGTEGAQIQAAATSAPGAVAWYPGTVEGAFEEARKSGRPVFLFWGATWCPYCAQVKATIFNRADFAERARAFVPVYLDGDGLDAQRLAERFHVQGYPTMLLLRPDGTEITRLPGEVDARRYMQVLALGLGSKRPIAETLHMALKGAPLETGDWQRLAYYAFDTDESNLVSANRLADVLSELAVNCAKKEAALATRFEQRALIASLDLKDPVRLDLPGLRGRLATLLADPAAIREAFDLLVNQPDKQLAALTAGRGTDRRRLAVAWDKALSQLAEDSTLSTTERLNALDGRIALARLITPKKLPPALVDTVLNAVADADRATQNVFERQSVIFAAAGVLANAGRLDDSDALLKAEIPHSQTPYYFMRMLGANARARGNAEVALDWYAQAWQAAQGGATRLQWGTGYLNGLLELAPNEEAKIEEVAGAIFGEAANLRDAWRERNRSALERTAGKLQEWNHDGTHAESFGRLVESFLPICERLPEDDPRRAACEGLLNRKS